MVAAASCTRRRTTYRSHRRSHSCRTRRQRRTAAHSPSHWLPSPSLPSGVGVHVGIGADRRERNLQPRRRCPSLRRHQPPPRHHRPSPCRRLPTPPPLPPPPHRRVRQHGRTRRRCNARCGHSPSVCRLSHNRRAPSPAAARRRRPPPRRRAAAPPPAPSRRRPLSRRAAPRGRRSAPHRRHAVASCAAALRCCEASPADSRRPTLRVARAASRGARRTAQCVAFARRHAWHRAGRRTAVASPPRRPALRRRRPSPPCCRAATALLRLTPHRRTPVAAPPVEPFSPPSPASRRAPRCRVARRAAVGAPVARRRAAHRAAV